MPGRIIVSYVLPSLFIFSASVLAFSKILSALFVALFLNSTGKEMDDIHSNIVNAVNDSFAIVSVKKRYEMNETHKRIWNEE